MRPAIPIHRIMLRYCKIVIVPVLSFWSHPGPFVPVPSRSRRPGPDIPSPVPSRSQSHYPFPSSRSRRLCPFVISGPSSRSHRLGPVGPDPSRSQSRHLCPFVSVPSSLSLRLGRVVSVASSRSIVSVHRLGPGSHRLAPVVFVSSPRSRFP